jgi:transposase
MRSQKDQLPSVALRMKAGRMLMAGETVKTTASELGISTATARRYASIIEKAGFAGLEQMGVGGRKSALNSDALNWLTAALKGSPKVHGFDTDQWTDGRLRIVIEQRFGVSFSRVYVRQLTLDLGLADRLTVRREQAPSVTPPVLDSEALSWIAAALRHSPKLEGFDADRWTNERLRTAIERRFGVRYSRMYVWRIATNLGLSHLITKTRK